MAGIAARPLKNSSYRHSLEKGNPENYRSLD